MGELKDAVQVKRATVGKSTQIRVYVPMEAVRSLEIKKGEKYRNLEVKSYKPGGRLDTQEFFYVTFKRQPSNA